jgi:hypothetical protein
MTEAEIVEFFEGRSPLLPGRSPTIAFDTNAIFGDHRSSDPGIELIDTINLINERRSAAPVIGMVIPALVLHEKLRKMAQRRGKAFDVSLPLAFLRAKNLVVKGFGLPHAVGTADRLSRAHPRQEDWRAFKKRRCLECLGLPETTSTQGDGHACGATVDWLIAGQAELKGYLLVTGDTGAEFRGLALSAPLRATDGEAISRIQAG